MSNPIFNNHALTRSAGVQPGRQVPDMSPEQLDALYGQASATPVQTDRMTVEDVVVKTAITLGAAFVGALVGFFVPALSIPAAIATLVLSLVNTFKKKPSPALVLTFGVAIGIMAGGISGVLGPRFEGIITQALLGTAAVFVTTLVLFLNGKIRASRRATKIFTIAIVAYGLFALTNFVLTLTGVTSGLGLRGFEIFGIPLGLIMGPLVILLGAYSLVLDFTEVQEGVRAGAPRIFGWRAAFGLTLTIVWLYIEIIRFLGIARSE
jgi:uncharacterized YccA/Bax inhibitor family protein